MMAYNADYCNMESKTMIKLIREKQANLQKKISVFFTIVMCGKCAKHCHMDTMKQKNLGSTSMIKNPNDT